MGATVRALREDCNSFIKFPRLSKRPTPFPNAGDMALTHLDSLSVHCDTRIDDQTCPILSIFGTIPSLPTANLVLVACGYPSSCSRLSLPVNLC